VTGCSRARFPKSCHANPKNPRQYHRAHNKGADRARFPTVWVLYSHRPFAPAIGWRPECIGTGHESRPDPYGNLVPILLQKSPAPRPVTKTGNIRLRKIGSLNQNSPTGLDLRKVFSDSGVENLFATVSANTRLMHRSKLGKQPSACGSTMQAASRSVTRRRYSTSRKTKRVTGRAVVT